MTFSGAAYAQNSLVCAILVGASTSGANATACGVNTVANGNNSTAYGFAATATGNSSSAYGASASSGAGATALGASSTASGTNSVALGNAAIASNTSGIAIGTSSSSSVANGIALGPAASVTASGAVAIGSGSLADTANTISVGTVGGERKIVNVADGTLSATSKDVVNGGQLFTTNSNVTTVSNNLATANANFLTANQRVAAAFGGGSAVDGSNIVTAPSYTVQGSTFNNVGGALGALDTKTTTNTSAISTLGSQVSSGSVGVVQQDATTRNISVGVGTNGTLVDLTGTAGTRKLTGLSAGTISAASSDAVIGAQLNTTNGNVTANIAAITTANTNFATANQRVASAFGGGSSVDGSNIVTAPSYTVQGSTFNNVGGALGALDTKTTTNTSAIATLSSQVSGGSAGLVQQDSTTRNISVGGGTNGTLVDLTGTAGTRKLTGLSAGTISAASSDAVTGAQLNTTNGNVTTVSNGLATANTNFATANQRIASAFGGGSTVDGSNIVTAPSYTVQGSTYNNVGSALGGLDTKVTTNTSSISTLNSQLSSGSIGLLQQDSTTRNISVGAATNGSVIDLTGTAGARKLTGLSTGTISAASSDAITGAQLNTTNGNVTANTGAIAANTSAITTANTSFATANQRIASAFGGGSTVDGSGIVTAPSYTVQGSTFNNVGGALGGLDTKVTTNTTGIADINSQIASGLIGLVQQNAATRTISVGAATDGTLVDLTGTAGTRRLTGLSAGTISAASSDAITGTQLNTTNGNVTTVTNGLATANTNFATANQRIASALGGGSIVDGSGIVTAPSYTVQGSTFTNVGGALGALDTKTTTNTSSIATINGQLTSGAIGLVQQDATTRNISVGASTNGSLIDMTGTAGTRKLTGLSAGTISAGSSEAITGAQLNTTNGNVTTNTSAIAANTGAITTANSNFATANQRTASAFGGGSSVDGSGIVTAPSYTVQGSTYNNVGGALGGLDSKVTTNTSAIATVNSQLSSGSIGLVQQDATTRNISVGASTNGSLVDLTGSAGTRKLTGLSAGAVSAISSDAITGAQLNTTNGNVTTVTNGLAAANSNFATANLRTASAFGGGSTVDGSGIVTAPSYTVQGSSFNNVGGALGALDTKTTTNTSSIATINGQLSSGSIGLVQQDATTRNISIGASTNGSLIDLTGSAGARKLTGLTAGTVNAASSDAITGAQLNSTNSNVTTLSNGLATANTSFATANQRIASAFGGGSIVDGSGIVTAPIYTVQGATFNNVGGAVGALDTKITTNTSDLAVLNTLLSGGSIGLARQDPITRNISIGAATNGTLVDLTGTAGSRKLTGLLAGTVSSSSTDAVTGAQLNATNANVTLNSGTIATVNSFFLTANQRIASGFGGGSAVDGNGIVTAPSYTVQGSTFNNVGSAFGALDTKVSSNTSSIAGINTQLANGAIGLVRQDSSTRNLSVGAATDGTLVDLTGSSGSRKLTGLLRGTIDAASTDAVTGAQLFEVDTQVATNTANFATANQRMAAIFGGGSGVDANGIVTAPSYAVLGSNFNNIGGALTALSSRVTLNSTNISALMAGGGTPGSAIVFQDPTLRTITVGATVDGTSVNVSGLSGNRTITGVAAGSVSAASTDVVNGAQLAATNTAVANVASYATNAATGVAAALGGNATVAANGTVTAPQYTVQQQSYNSVGAAFSAVDSALSTVNTTIQNSTTTMQQTQMELRYVEATGTGRDAVATGTNAVAFGSDSVASGDKSIAMGESSVASKTGAIAVGSAAQASGVNAIAIGTGAVATGSVALGVNASAANGGAALGDNTVSTGANSAALGPGSTATAANAVAIGSGSVANEANVISVGAAGTERRITNVAAGIAPTDAVNVSQLNSTATGLQGQIDNLQGSVNQLSQTVKRTAGGVAMAMAMSGGSLPDNKRFGMGMNVGTYSGQYALSVSNYFRLTNSIVLSSAVAYQDGQIGARAGLMAAW